MNLADSTLADIAQGILTAADQGLADVDGVDRRRTRTYIAIGPEFPVDCALLAVHLNDLTSTVAPAAQQAGRVGKASGPSTTTAAYVVTVSVDCVPVPDGKARKIPTPAAETAASRELLTDGYAVRNAVLDGLRDGSVFAEVRTDDDPPGDYPAGCLHGAVGSLGPHPRAQPAANIAAMTVPVTVRLDIR